MIFFGQDFLDAPVRGRQNKPREIGVTMLLDKGMTPGATRDLLELNAPFLDFIKLSFGSIALYPENHLREKIAMAAAYDVIVYPGGTSLEIAFWRGASDSFVERLRELGCQWIEISDGTLDIPLPDRIGLIQSAIQKGFHVITEVGKKDPRRQPTEADLIAIALADLDAGARWVIIEARESGQGIGIYDEAGNILEAKLEPLRQKLPLDRIIWEAPLKSQQANLINRFGPNVSLGNIPPAECMALEALRRGLRSDTWRPLLK